MTQPTDTIEDKAGTIGPPMPGVEVKIVDPVSGETMAVGVVGEYCTRGYHVMHSYFENPEATANAIDAEGWLHTGDLCAMDERGYCTVEGRLKDMIIRGGENIYPLRREHLAPHKTPTKWFAVDNFPLTGSGKIQKFKLRTQWATGQWDEL